MADLPSLRAALLRRFAQLVDHRAADSLRFAALPTLDGPPVVSEDRASLNLGEVKGLSYPPELGSADARRLHGADPSTAFCRESRKTVDTTFCRLIPSALVTRQTVVVGIR